MEYFNLKFQLLLENYTIVYTGPGFSYSRTS